MCDHGRFSFPHFDAPGRLAGALARGTDGLEPCDPADALDEIADLLRVHGAPLVVASPWLTQEEARAAKELGGERLFLAPDPSPLKDDFLHTGDPCPNRRGLTELGYAPVSPADALARLRAAKLAFLLGERAVETAGIEALSTLPASLRLVVFDVRPLASPAAYVEIGVPDSCERTGTWLNVDGHAGLLSIARSAPKGVAPLVRTLEEISRRTKGALAR
jgi:hypothetical protein